MSYVALTYTTEFALYTKCDNADGSLPPSEDVLKRDPPQGRTLTPQVTTLLTVYALIGDDMRLIFTAKDADETSLGLLKCSPIYFVFFAGPVTVTWSNMS